MVRTLIALVVFLAAGAAGAGCFDPVAVTATTDDYYNLGGSASTQVMYAVSFEPDATGSETTATITLSLCSRTTGDDACLDLDYDSTGDNVADTNILDGLTTEKTGVVFPVSFRYLRIEVGTAPSGTDEPEYTVCRLDS